MKVKAIQVAFCRILVKANNLSAEKLGDGQPYSCEQPGGGEDHGEAKEGGTVTKGSQASQNELSIGVLFDNMDLD